MRETEKGFKLRDLFDYYDIEGIENYNDQLIDDLMMSGTSVNNKLANEEFVNSSITHMAANPRGNWPNWSLVPTDPTLYPADADGNKTPSNNDYMVVQDMTDYTNPDEPSRTYEGTWRFTYVGEWDDPVPGGTKGKLGWKPIYQVNEKPLTQAQVDALNSGINSTKVTNYDNHLQNTNNPHNVTKAQLGLEHVNNTSDVNKPVSNAQQTELNKKVNIAQGSQNAGKVLGIDSEGNVIPVDQQGGATPEQLATKLDKTKDIRKIEVVTELPEARDLYTMYMIVEDTENWPGLHFHCDDSEDATISYSIIGKRLDIDLWWSYDPCGAEGNWNEWEPDYPIAFNYNNIYVWNKTKTLSKDEYNYVKFNMSSGSVTDAKIEAYGNILSLIDFAELTPGCFNRLFAGCDILLFAPLLPSTTLAEGCYCEMFVNCSSLRIAPELPATTLAEYCYYFMFGNCTSLTTAPELPAMTLAKGCYAFMFVGCTSLTTAPELPADTLAKDCYAFMFRNCTDLNSIKLWYTGNFGSENGFFQWVDGVSQNGILYYKGSDTTRCSSAIPQNWAVESF